MGPMAGQFPPFGIQDASEQHIRERVLGVRAFGHYRRSVGMEFERRLHPQFPGHHTSSFGIELCDRAVIGQARSDSGRITECDVWERGGIDSMSHPLSACWTTLTWPKVSIVALTNGEIRIVQSSMLGSILSNILLVLGCCFLAGGIKNPPEQEFNRTMASTMSSLMAVSSASLIIPATLYAALKSSAASSEDNILVLSHATAIILLILYVLYLVFQLRTHAHLFDGENGSHEDGSNEHGRNEEVPEEEHILGPWAAGVALVVVTVMVAICAEYLVNSIDSIVQSAHISKTFIGLILLPIVGNAAEHVTAVVVAWKNKMDLAIGVAIGSSMQIALLVTPFLVILGWIINQPMTLKFESFETVVFFLSVLITNYLISVRQNPALSISLANLS